MSVDVVVVNLGALALMAWIAWYFRLGGRR